MPSFTVVPRVGVDAEHDAVERRVARLLRYTTFGEHVDRGERGLLPRQRSGPSPTGTVTSAATPLLIFRWTVMPCDRLRCRAAGLLLGDRALGQVGVDDL